jgi:hypothetical protein
MCCVGRCKRARRSLCAGRGGGAGLRVGDGAGATLLCGFTAREPMETPGVEGRGEEEREGRAWRYLVGEGAGDEAGRAVVGVVIAKGKERILVVFKAVGGGRWDGSRWRRRMVAEVCTASWNVMIQCV